MSAGVKLKGSFSTLEVDRASTRKVVIRFRALMGLSIALSVIVPLLLIGFVFLSVGIGETGVPPFLYAAFAGFGCIGIVMARSTLASSKVKVTIDRQRSTLIVESRSARAELPMREISSAEIGSFAGTSSYTSYRLEIVLRNGKRIPATSSFNNLYLVSDLESVLKTINAELGADSQRIT